MKFSSAQRFFFYTLLLYSACLSFAHAEKDVMLIIDSSRSMNEVDSSDLSKLDSAKIALVKMIARLKGADKHISLMAYGHRRSVDCKDVEVLIPPGNDDIPLLLEKIDQLTPKGVTPLSYALNQANAELSKQESSSILLLTDGIESCDGDPCESVKKMQANSKINLVINVVGYKVPKEVSGQLECIAKSSRGKYYSVNDPWHLVRTMQRIVLTGNVRFETTVNVPFDELESIRIVKYRDKKNIHLKPIVELNKIYGINTHFWEEIVLPEGDYAAYIKMPNRKQYEVAIKKFQVDGGRTTKVPMSFR